MFTGCGERIFNFCKFWGTVYMVYTFNGRSVESIHSTDLPLNVHIQPFNGFVHSIQHIHCVWGNLYIYLW